MPDKDLVGLISAAAFVMFTGAVIVGFLTTLDRVLYYAKHRVPRPRLLTRDVIVIGGLALSFGQIIAARFLLSPEERAVLGENVLWALSTSIPAVVSAITYAYYELFIVERDR